MSGLQVALLVPRRHVKTVKTALEGRSLLDRASKITAEKNDGEVKEKDELRMIIPTAITTASIRLDCEGKAVQKDAQEMKNNLLHDLGLTHLNHEISITAISPRADATTPAERNPVVKALREALETLPQPLLALLELSVDALVSSFPDSYSVYRPMLLLPHNSFVSASWNRLFESHPADCETLTVVWRKIAEGLGVSHIAVNAGIPLQTGSSNENEADLDSDDNILRSPTNLTPIYGDFGPPITPSRLTQPTPEDFASAFWVSHTQNGIHQTWAPRYTMFSRGNIREKTRILNHRAVHSSIAQGRGTYDGSTSTTAHGLDWEQNKSGCTAVDLYAGIGYFAFSYKRAGVSQVFCWELNPWSIEGLRRGAKRNGWTTQIFTKVPDGAKGWEKWRTEVQDVDFLIFQESNEEAGRAMQFLKYHASGVSIPPVRHVNCGFLPSSKLSWETAVRAIDHHLGGWIHAHENVAVNSIDIRKDEVVSEMQTYLDAWMGEIGSCGAYRRNAKWEYTERVKTYAPGVVHVVFDISVDGMRDAETY